MLTARARHAMARWWRRCAGGGPCMRVPWGEGNGDGGVSAGARVRVGDAPPRAPALDSRFRGNDDGGVSARGSCQGGGCTAPRPCPGFPLSRERRWGSWREGFVSGWGMHRPAPLPWIPAFAGTTMGECGFGKRARRGVAGSGDGKAALRTGSGRRDLGSAGRAVRFERPSGLWHHC